MSSSHDLIAIGGVDKSGGNLVLIGNLLSFEDCLNNVCKEVGPFCGGDFGMSYTSVDISPIIGNESSCS